MPQPGREAERADERADGIPGQTEDEVGPLRDSEDEGFSRFDAQLGDAQVDAQLAEQTRDVIVHTHAHAAADEGCSRCPRAAIINSIPSGVNTKVVTSIFTF